MRPVFQFYLEYPRRHTRFFLVIPCNLRSKSHVNVHLHVHTQPVLSLLYYLDPKHRECNQIVLPLTFLALVPLDTRHQVLGVDTALQSELSVLQVGLWFIQACKQLVTRQMRGFASHATR